MDEKNKDFQVEGKEKNFENQHKTNAQTIKNYKIFGILTTALGVLIFIVSFLAKKDSIANIILPMVFGIITVALGVFLFVRYYILKKRLLKEFKGVEKSEDNVKIVNEAEDERKNEEDNKGISQQ